MTSVFGTYSIIFIMMAVVISMLCLHGLLSGKTSLGYGENSVRRDEKPLHYWFTIISLAAFAGGMFYGAYIIGDTADKTAAYEQGARSDAPAADEH